MLQEPKVSIFRLYLSAICPTINELRVKRTVNAVEASRPYYDLVKSKSIFMASDVDTVVVVAASEVVVEKSTRYDIEKRHHSFEM